MVALDLQQILTAARQLPKPAQAQLVSALLQAQGSAHTPALEPLTGLSEAELYALATSVLALAHARRLKQLLRLHRREKVDACLASRTGCVTRRKRPHCLSESESQLYAEPPEGMMHGPYPAAASAGCHCRRSGLLRVLPEPRADDGGCIRDRPRHPTECRGPYPTRQSVLELSHVQGAIILPPLLTGVDPIPCCLLTTIP